MKKILLLFLLMTVLLALLPPVGLPVTSTVAQAQDTGARDWSGVRALAPSTELIVETKSGDTIDGYLNDVAETKMSISPIDTSAVVMLERDGINRIYLARRRSKSRATKIGAGIGAAIGFGLGLALAVKAAKNSDPTAAPVLFPVYGAGAGALVGAVTGGKVRKGRLVYESQ